MKAHRRKMSALVAFAGAVLLGISCSDKSTTSSDGTSVLAPLNSVRPPAQATDRFIVLLVDSVRNIPETARRLTAPHGGAIRHVYQHALRGFSASLPAIALDVVRANPAVAFVQQVEAGKFRLGDHTVQTGAPWGLDRINQRNLPLDTKYSYGERVPASGSM